ncbi:MAG TPA: NAD(P)-dependent oxidoreductase [Chitinophagales bacterium]|nr:NAD(P)-dependent oxidoreductase [Chitinophagales bacterium]
MSFKNKTVFITGGTRGIGLAIGKRLAKEGANVVIVAKTVEPHPKLEGTIYTAAAEIDEAGGKGFAVQCDIRFEDQVENAVQQTVDKFGGIDILINNASAISLTPTLETSMKRYDLMNQINGRGTFMTSQKCLPHLLKSDNPHILNLSPPLNFEPKWFGPHVAYSIAKYNMSLCVLGMAEEFKGRVGVNALWPRTTIATAAVQNLLGGDEMIKRSRTPEILADAAYYILSKPAAEVSGNFFVDDDVLAAEGITDLDHYAVNPKFELIPDFFV